MANINEITFPGYLTPEIEAFFGQNLKREEREGMGVMGYWVTTLGGEVMLRKGIIFSKNENGEIVKK